MSSVRDGDLNDDDTESSQQPFQDSHSTNNNRESTSFHPPTDVAAASMDATNHSLLQINQPPQTTIRLFRDEWELTWPIWHMLSREERRLLAHQHGYKTIGEFEEFVSLQRAVGDSSDGIINTTSTQQQPYDNEWAYYPGIHDNNDNNNNNNDRHHRNKNPSPTSNDGSTTGKVSAVTTSKLFKSKKYTSRRTEEDEDDSVDDDDNHDETNDKVLTRKSSTASTAPSTTASTSTTSSSASDNDDTVQGNNNSTSAATTSYNVDVSTDELIEHGGLILLLPEELIHAIFRYLPVDMYGTLAWVSPYWKHFTRTEAVYQKLCERIYLQQSHRKTMALHAFNNSYRIMLERRGRVKAGGGVYVLKYCEVKPIQRDMWTEIPVGAILESIYYRYLYFQEDGRVLYALTSLPPTDVFRRFHKKCLPKSTSSNQYYPSHHHHHHHENNADADDDIAVWGTFTVKRNQVIVTAQQSWHTVQMHLILPDHNRQTTKKDLSQPQHHRHTTTTTTTSTTIAGCPHGRFGTLTMQRHLSSKSGNFDERTSRDLVEYKVPLDVFRFVKDSRL